MSTERKWKCAHCGAQNRTKFSHDAGPLGIVIEGFQDQVTLTSTFENAYGHGRRMQTLSPAQAVEMAMVILEEARRALPEDKPAHDDMPEGYQHEVG